MRTRRVPKIIGIEMVRGFILITYKMTVRLPTLASIELRISLGNSRFRVNISVRIAIGQPSSFSVTFPEHFRKVNTTLDISKTTRLQWNPLSVHEPNVI